MSQNNDFFQKSLDYQKELTNKWLENLQKLTPSAENLPKDAKGVTDWYLQMVNSYQTMMNEWSKSFSSVNPFFKVQPFGLTNLFQSSNTQYDVFNKIMNSTSFYNDLYQLYTKIVGKDPFDSAKEIENFLASQRATYEQLAEDVLNPLLPEEAKMLLDSSKEVLGKWENLGKDLIAPWNASAEESKAIMERIAKGEVGAYKDLYQLSLSAYEKSFGKLFNVSSLGLSRAQSEQAMDNFDSFNRMYIAQTQLLSYVQDAAKQNLVEVVKQFQEAVSLDKAPKSMKDFCDLYVKVNDEAFTKLMGTDEFTTLFTEYGKYFAIYKQETDKMLEKTLSWMPFPKNSDMQALYKTVYDLRKQCYYDHKKIEELEEKLASKSKK